LYLPPDTSDKSSDLHYPLPGLYGGGNGLYMKDPSNIKEVVEYDADNKQYIITRKVGNLNLGETKILSEKEYKKYDMERRMREYWDEKNKSKEIDKKNFNLLAPEIHVPGKVFDKIFGSDVIEIKPQGSAELIFAVNSNKRDDPQLDVRQRRITNFDFQQKIQMNLLAKIGDKINLRANYNTEANFDFENKMKLEYTGKEDEIIKKIEAGDVSLPLNSSLIQGSQALFGLKTSLQFGKMTITSVVCQQKSESKSIEISGGAQTSKFSIKADEYEENRHFLLGQYFRNHYDSSLSKLPLVRSNIIITRLEVWVTNIGAATSDNRNIIAFTDLGESSPYNSSIIKPYINNGSDLPDNKVNTLYKILTDSMNFRDITTASSKLQSLGFTPGVDYEKVQHARKLSPSEYTYNSKLGFISLNISLNPDYVLAVAYEYQVIGDTTRYKVGEFSTDGINEPNALMVKLIKGSVTNTKLPLWNLMMKNVYSIGGYQISNKDFRLNILYSNEENGFPSGYISEGLISGQNLLKVMSLDRLNTFMDPQPDGVFDFIDNASVSGGTIESKNGRIYFPVLEPFGSHLRSKIGDKNIADKYCFDSLYTCTKTIAQQFPEKNKFILAGSYKSSSGSRISLNAMNIPQGSVKVTSGGIQLEENKDYTVDYNMGEVKIINEGYLNSGAPIKITLESNSLFNIQTKTLLGTHVDYKFSDKFILGGTIMNLTERPLTQKVNIGNDPISNTILGINGVYQNEAPYITKLIDGLPFYNTKEMSKINISGEFAYFIPGHPKAIGKKGIIYIDDFEGSRSSIDIKNYGMWFLASVPPSQQKEARDNGSGLAYNYNRAKLAWYTIDNSVFYRNKEETPSHIKKDLNQLSDHRVREVLETEVFPNKESPNGQPVTLSVLNLAYYPKERGPYNYTVEPDNYSRGIDENGFLKEPKERWAGIMRKIDETDFESRNIETIEFWLMDPFVSGNSVTGGDLYIDLGDISEDILRDGKKYSENGMPISEDLTNVDTTIWGRVPLIDPLIKTFDNNSSSRKYQDIGLDGLNTEEERNFYASYLEKIKNIYGEGSLAYNKAIQDPSADNYHFYRGSDYDNAQVSILDRYKNFNNTEGNSPTRDQSPESYSTAATNQPDVEDINQDNTLSESENYFEYRVSIRSKDMMEIGKNHISDIAVQNVTLRNGTKTTVKWYQFKIPISEYESKYGKIQDFKSIKFIRVYLKGFEDETVLRFGTFELVRSEWKKYNFSMLSPGEYIMDDNINKTTFEVSAVNIEENGVRTPIPYVVPPGIEREINIGTTNLQKLNEQSLAVKVCDLQDGDSRAIYKTGNLDLRKYKKMKMFIHGESLGSEDAVKNGDLVAFIRLGTDFSSNYYEYEVPLSMTPWGSTNKDVIWPSENNVDIDLSKLQEIKQKRNIAIRNNGVSGYNIPYSDYIGNNRVTVLGNPNLSDIVVVMLGVRNPKAVNNSDDGLSKCAEIWFNELRLTDFDESGGWASTARVSTNLADLGDLSMAGTIITPGFGGIEQRIDERHKETIKQYDISTNVELGKFLPENSGIKIPMHFDISEIYSTPQYNPLNPDIKYKDDIKTYKSPSERDSIRKMVQDYTSRRSINFINVRKNKTGGETKTHIYDIENFTFSYAFTEQYKRNVDVEFDFTKNHKGSVEWNYSYNPKKVSPFSKIKWMNKKSLKLLRDFNFYYLPKNLSFRSDMDRMYSETKLRNTSGYDIIIDTTYIKSFLWNRSYGLKYDLCQSIKIDYSAVANSRVGERPGLIDKKNRWEDYKLQRDSIWKSIFNMGIINNYNQNVNLSYIIPINKLPLMDWITATYNYNGDYQWVAAPLSAVELGNTISNNNSNQYQLQLSMKTLYNKWKYLKKLDQKEIKKIKGIGLASEDTLKLKKKTGEERIRDMRDLFVRILISLKNVSMSYSKNNGSVIPGFLEVPKYMGMDIGKRAPGYGYVFGVQPSNSDIERFFNKGWMVTSSDFNMAFMKKYSENFNMRATLEPYNDLKVDITSNSSYSLTSQKYLKSSGIGYSEYNATETGNFSMSFISIKTSFVKSDKKTNTNKNFENMKKHAMVIAERLANKNPNFEGGYDSLGFPSGYGLTAPQVLIPAFISAYSGKSPSKVSTSLFRMFPKLPYPNWKLTYSGLSKLEFFEKYFKSFTMSHGYTSSYSVGTFSSNSNYKERDGYEYVRQVIDNRKGNYIMKYDITSVSINEQFNPLLDFNMQWKNSLTTRIEFKKRRDISLSLVNNMITEVGSKEIVLGAGYRFKDIEFSFITSSKNKKIKSDINLRADFSIRENKTILRKIVENYNLISAGQRIISISISADYALNERFTIRAFFEKMINNPFVSMQYPTSNTNGGISVKFSLIP